MRFLSWPGAKYRQINYITQHYPKRIRAMAEPFWGTGAVTCQLLDRIEGPLYAAEACLPLYWWWKNILHSPKDMIQLMDEMREKFAQAKESRKVFDLLRDGWNQAWKENPSDPTTAAVLWVLIYQSTNNLARFNSRGEYNQTWGVGRNVPDPKIVFNDHAQEVLSRLADGFSAGCFATDFAIALDQFLRHHDVGDAAYLDPPYIVRTETYQRGCWDMDSLNRLMQYVREMERRGVHWTMSEYLRKGDVVHPYADEFQTAYQVKELPRRLDARPKGEHLPTEEILVMSRNAPEREASFISTLPSFELAAG